MTEAELYIHIPFCVKKCAYCDFLSFPAKDEFFERYVTALCHEAAAASYELRNHEIRSVFFGGGTPTILLAKQLDQILNMLIRSFAINKDAEITLECNPDTGQEEKLVDLKKAGFNRLSIGAQSFDDELLKTIGRIHNSRQTIACYEKGRRAGFENINLDLISALPGQTAKNWIETLRTAVDLSPEHISAYSLILEENTPLFDKQNSFVFPSEEEERRMADQTEKLLFDYGYSQYEISNYAKPGKECIHNIGYWVGVPYKGLGLGASSYVNGVRYKNTEDYSEYLENCNNPKKQYKEIQTLSKEEKMSEFVILGLRMTKGISTIEFQKRFGEDFDTVFPGITDKYVSMGLMKREKNQIAFTRSGMAVSNVILSDYYV